MVITNWKKLENENGFPFYIDETTNQSQWDHPKFNEVRQLLTDCNYIKYSKYRLALKFRTLQRALFTENVTLATIIGVFDRHHLGMNESAFCLESYDLEAVLYDILFAAKKINQNADFDVDFGVELLLNFLYNIYDPDRKGKIQVSSAKLVLALLSDCTLSDLFRFIFNLCADHNNIVTRLRLQSILNKFIEVVNFLHEDVSFGGHLVSSTVENCFIDSPGLVGMTENSFLSWLEDSPLLFCWISILHRLKTSEFVVHGGKCVTCKGSPLVGLKYTCTKCLKYIQCQRCFFMGQINHSHKLTHSMREHSHESGRSEFSLRFIRKLASLLPCRVRPNETFVQKADEKAHFCRSIENESLSAPHSQLQLIIRRLEAQNSQLCNILLAGDHNEAEIRRYLEQHRSQVESQIQKLKQFREGLSLGLFTPKRRIAQSTPMAHGHNYRTLPLLSPIAQFLDEEEPSKSETKPIDAYSVNDISTWIKSGNNKEIDVQKAPVREMHNDLDDALDKLQQILANNFTLDELGGNFNNKDLKNAVSEVEDMLVSFIDNVEHSRANSTLPKVEIELL